MNVLWLHPDPEECAKMHMDRHVNYRLEDAVRALCEASAIKGYKKHWMYEQTYSQHPVIMWLRDSYANWEYVYDLAKALYDEYQYRQGRDAEHTAGEMIDRFETDKVKKCYALKDEMTKPPQCVGDCPELPENYAKENGIDKERWALGFEWPEVVEAYRYYYVDNFEKQAKWKIRPRPQWWPVYEVTLGEYLSMYGEDAGEDEVSA